MSSTNGSSNNGSSNNDKKKKGSRVGIDILLQRKGKSLQTGQQISFQLVKGPSINRDGVPDPVNPSAPQECFPLIAKFPESVVRPDFDRKEWQEARLYQQDVPKAQIDSDEEAEEAAALESKKRWRRKRTDPPKRQWVLQEQVEFLETMMAKRQKKADIYGSKNGDTSSAAATSSRYEGHPDHNPSHFVLLECSYPNHNKSNQFADGGGATTTSATAAGEPTIKVTLLPAPPNANVTFSQPASRKGLSMNEAELAIQDQRNQMTRYMMQNKNQSSFLAGGNAKPVNQSKARLLGKLQKVAKSGGAAGEGENDDNDDIMGDIAFRERKGNNRARKELLSSLGDGGVRVDGDGVLGGANDDEFGGKRHFGAFKANAEDAKNKEAAGGGGGKGEQGNAGMAMEEGFYQRDVKAEYDELDYDVEEQFDDDDVDVGETDMAIDTGFAQEEDSEDEDDEDMDNGGETVLGAEGLASVAGFKAMLAKARRDPGATEQPTEGENVDANGKEAGKKDPKKHSDRAAKKRSDEQASHLDRIFDAAAKFKKTASKAAEEVVAAPKAEEAVEPTVDENGLRIISLPVVRKEIWLNHGQISMKRLMKLFDINKKSEKERQDKFRQVLKELCTMEKDPVGGRLLVLKQHYRNMMLE